MLVVLFGCQDDPSPRPPAEVPSETGTMPHRPAATVPPPFGPCINEVMPDNRVSASDERGVASDWIELHNPGRGPVALAGWTMTDDPADPWRHRLDPALVIEPGGFLVLWADDRADLGPTHLGFALSDDGEAVALFAPDGDGSVVSFGPVPSDLAIARETDCCRGEGCIGLVFAGTPGETNR